MRNIIIGALQFISKKSYGEIFYLESLKSSRVDSFKSKPIIVSSTSPISEVMGILKQNNAYEVFIQERDKVSTITIREILKASDISNMRASSLMFLSLIHI